MATKAEIKALQDANLASGIGIAASSHRAVLNTNAASLLENVYADAINEGNILPATISLTTANANFKYSLQIVKTGRSVNIQGSIVAQATVGSGGLVFEITDAEYLMGYSHYFTGFSNNDSLNFRFISNQLLLMGTILSGETFRINTTYFVTD